MPAALNTPCKLCHPPLQSGSIQPWGQRAPGVAVLTATVPHQKSRIVTAAWDVIHNPVDVGLVPAAL